MGISGWGNTALVQMRATTKCTGWAQECQKGGWDWKGTDLRKWSMFFLRMTMWFILTMVRTATKRAACLFTWMCHGHIRTSFRLCEWLFVREMVWVCRDAFAQWFTRVDKSDGLLRCICIWNLLDIVGLTTWPSLAQTNCEEWTLKHSQLATCGSSQ